MAENRINEIVKLILAEYPNAECELNFTNPFELLIATILSAQSTDVTVNKVTKELFKKYKQPEDYLSVPIEELEQDIHSTGFYHNKAKSIRGACEKLIAEFGGKIPKTMKELLTLPGVARKTANVVLSTAFGIPVGIVVDTHVLRLSQRMKLTKETKREKIEANLMKKIPKENWIRFGHALIWHGRRVCQAKKPKCHDCVVRDLCPSAI